VNKYLHIVASFGFLFTLNYDARKHKLKKKLKKVCAEILCTFVSVLPLFCSKNVANKMMLENAVILLQSGMFKRTNCNAVVAK